MKNPTGKPAILACIAEHGPATASEIAARIGATPKGTGVMIAQLRNAGLVRKAGEVHNRHNNVVWLWGLAKANSCALEQAWPMRVRVNAESGERV